MNTLSRKIVGFFGAFPPDPLRDPIIERLRLVTYYGFIGFILLTGSFNQYILGPKLDINTIIVFVASFASLIALWAFRNPRLARILEGASVVGLMAIALVTGGGARGFGILYVLTFPLFLYFLLDFFPSMLISVAYCAVTEVLLRQYPFPEGSFLALGEYSSRVGLTVLAFTLGSCIFMGAFEIIVRHLSSLALLDRSTGLPNRSRIEGFTRERLELAAMNGTPLSLLAVKIIDLHKMERIYGSREMEAALGRIGRRMSLAGGNPCILGRWNAGLFMALFQAPSEEEIRKLLDAARTPLRDGTQSIIPGIAAAVYSFPRDANSAEELLSGPVAMLESADLEDGAVLTPDKTWLERQEIRKALLDAVERNGLDGEFSVRYQPKIRLGDKTCAGAEALLRWAPPGRKPVPPDVFIPLAEETGLITKLTRWVTYRVFRDHAENAKDFGPHGIPPCSVNLSLHDLRDQNLMEMIELAILETGCRSEWIEFEITERLMVADDARVKASLERLDAAGFRIFIDDFGTGYSSLSYLHRLKVHGLKLDRSFLPDGESAGELDNPVVNAILSMSSALGLSVTAEGVEKESQAEYLKDRGCDLAQGWLYSRDLSFADYIAFYGRNLPSGLETLHDPA